MRPTRRFRPVLDSLQARIAPAAVAPALPVAPAAAVSESPAPAAPGSGLTMTAMDDTGSPGDPTGGTWTIHILSNPPGTTSSTGTSVC